MLAYCKGCGMQKSRIKHTQKLRGGVYPSGWNYVDDVGSFWEGKSCPQCVRLRKAGKYDVRRKELGRVVRRNIPVEQMGPGRAPGAKLRKCQSCKGKTINYFYCARCLANKTENWNDLSEQYGMVYGTI